jgi:hypothetical protein
MMPQLLFYQLVLVALVWLFILLHLAEPNRAASSPPFGGRFFVNP